MDLKINVKYGPEELPELLDLLRHIKNRKIGRRVRITDFTVADPYKLLSIGNGGNK